MDNERFLLLVARKLSGEASTRDLEELSACFEEDTQNRKKFDLLKAHWESKSNIRTDIDAALVKTISRLQEDRNQSNSEGQAVPISNENPGVRRYFALFSKVAAVLILCLISAYFIYRNNNQSIATSVATNKVTNWESEQTPKGTKSTFFLEDGTKVTLNADSKLRFPKSFLGATREIYLTGEAFFDVAHNADMPFIIHTGRMNIKVLGTEFNVKSYPQDSTYETTLLRGSIEVTLNDRPSDRIILKPKEKLIVANLSFGNAHESKVSTHVVQPQLLVTELHYVSKTDRAIAETSWLDNKLVFEDESFTNLAINLGRKYNVNIHFSNEKLKDYRFTGIFKEETIQEALTALQLTEKFSFKIMGSEVYIF